MSTKNILQYESKIWATADLLRGCGIKESEWPSYMMPFFALVMIESRLVRMFDELKAEIGEEAWVGIEPIELIELIQDKGQGYNIYILEAVIQLPTDEFFNTGIYTYLWVLNKNKPSDRQERVMLINASEKFKPLKKSKGSKRKEVDEASRLEVVQTLARFVDNDYTRVFEKEFFYFNKQAIMLTNVDERGRTFASHLKEGKTSLKLSPLKLDNGERTLTEFAITEYDSERFGSLTEVFEQDIKPFVDSLDYKEQPLVVTTEKAMYQFDAERETLIKEALGKREELGCGKIVVKAALKKGTKTQSERIEITVELTPDYQKDYEIIPFHRDEIANRAAIEAFMARYITKPFEYLENVVGVEINFNKVFYKPEKLRSLEEILGEIAALDEELKGLEELIIL